MENCFCPIPSVAYSEIRPLCATLALVSGKRPAWFKARIVQLAHQFRASVLSSTWAVDARAVAGFLEGEKEPVSDFTLKKEGKERGGKPPNWSESG